MATDYEINWNDLLRLLELSKSDNLLTLSFIGVPTQQIYGVAPISIVNNLSFAMVYKSGDEKHFSGISLEKSSFDTGVLIYLSRDIDLDNLVGIRIYCVNGETIGKKFVFQK